MWLCEPLDMNHIKTVWAFNEELYHVPMTETMEYFYMYKSFSFKNCLLLTVQRQNQFFSLFFCIVIPFEKGKANMSSDQAVDFFLHVLQMKTLKI